MKSPKEPIYVTAKMDTSHCFLPRVATLRVRDCTELVEIGFLWNRRVVHVDSPLRPSGFNTRDVPRTRASGDGTSGEKTVPHRRVERGWRKDLIAFGIKLGVTRDHDARVSVHHL